ncbi:MAG: hypothetical protein WCJ11_12160 [Methylococcaceae bacterium]
MKPLNLSRQTGNIKLTGLDLWQPTFPQLCRAFSTPKIDGDKLNAGYFLRCAGTKRGNETVADTADLLILDGDSRIGIDGTVTNGAVNPMELHLLLNWLNIDHFIYTSHSHTKAHGFDDGVNKYRVLIPVTYTRQQLPALLSWLFDRMTDNGIELVNVKENSSWAQAWFMPCMPMERAHLFKTWRRVGGKSSNPIEGFELEPAPPFDVAKICADYQNKQSPVNNQITTLSQIPVTNLSANPIEAFNASFSVHDVLIRNGYKQQGKRYLHPNSASKIAGVRILDTGRAYSDSSDSLNDGKSHDAFDCYRLLECGGDMKAALNWNRELTKQNQRAFYEVPEMQNPQQSETVTGLRYSVQLPSFENFLGSQAQISTAITV